MDYKRETADNRRLPAVYFCTGGEARTPDTRFWRPVLYQLSYSRKNQFPVSYDRELIILII